MGVVDYKSRTKEVPDLARRLLVQDFQMPLYLLAARMAGFSEAREAAWISLHTGESVTFDQVLAKAGISADALLETGMEARERAREEGTPNLANAVETLITEAREGRFPDPDRGLRALQLSAGVPNHRSSPGRGGGGMRRAPQQWELPLGPIELPGEAPESGSAEGAGGAAPLRRSVDDAHPWLEQNLVLRPARGPGKTWSLVTLALHVLAGAREQGPVRPAELCMLTFTDKAAGEMRRRLRERLEKLSLDVEPGEEEEVLRSSFARLGRPLPTPAEWRVLRTRSEPPTWAPSTRSASSSCAVRRRDAAWTPTSSCSRSASARGSPGDHGGGRRSWPRSMRRIRRWPQLVEELGFAPQGRSAGLSGELVSVLGRLREEGLGAESLELASQAEVEAHFQRQVAALAQAVEETRAEDGQRTLTATCDALARLVPHLSPESFVSGGMGDRLAEVLAGADEAVRLEKQVKRPRGVKAPGPMVKRLRRLALGAELPESLESLAAAWRSAPFEATLRRLLASLQKEHRAALERRGVLDFTELLVRTRDLLRDFPSARRAAQARARVLLVDEFQDTNRLQLELVHAAGGAPGGSAPAVGSDPRSTRCRSSRPRSASSATASSPSTSSAARTCRSSGAPSAGSWRRADAVSTSRSTAAPRRRSSSSSTPASRG